MRYMLALAANLLLFAAELKCDRSSATSYKIVLKPLYLINRKQSHDYTKKHLKSERHQQAAALRNGGKQFNKRTVVHTADYNKEVGKNLQPVKNYNITAPRHSRHTRHRLLWRFKRHKDLLQNPRIQRAYARMKKARDAYLKAKTNFADYEKQQREQKAKRRQERINRLSHRMSRKKHKKSDQKNKDSNKKDDQSNNNKKAPKTNNVKSKAKSENHVWTTGTKQLSNYSHSVKVHRSNSSKLNRRSVKRINTWVRYRELKSPFSHKDNPDVLMDRMRRRLEKRKKRDSKVIQGDENVERLLEGTKIGTYRVSKTTHGHKHHRKGRNSKSYEYRGHRKEHVRMSGSGKVNKGNRNDNFTPMGGEGFGPVTEEKEFQKQYRDQFVDNAKETIPWEEPQLMANCWAQAMLSANAQFSPNCNRDGSFSAKQCHLQRCWCVYRDGSQKVRNFNKRFSYGLAGLLLKCV